MKILILMAFALMGCSGNPMQPSVVTENVIAVGTLADANDPYDMAAAPVITKTTVVRISATRALQQRRITPDQAQLAQNCADYAVDVVNKGYAEKDYGRISKASAYADVCKAKLNQYKGVK